jgi:MFS family permease
MKKASLNISFIAASISFLMVFAASATPIPLYDIYRIEEHLTYNDLALTAVVYFIGAITALLFFGRISNHLGRKPVAFIIFALTTIATIMLLDVNSAEILIFARLLLGLACGLASSSITSYIVDNGTSLPQWIPAAIVSNSPMIGLTIGALISGSLVQFAPYQRVLCYVFILVVLTICTILIAYSEETVQKTPGLLKSLKPKFSLPIKSKKFFPIAAVTFVSTWAMGAFYQAFGPSIAVDQLGTHNTLIIAILFGSYLLPSAIGGPISAKLEPADAQRFGMFCFSIGVMGIIFSLKISSLWLFILSSAVAGASQGAVLTGSIRSVMKDVTIQERAGILSLIYATSYAGAAIPSFIAGQMSHYMDLFHVSIFYGVLAISACILTLIFARKPKLVEVNHD